MKQDIAGLDAGEGYPRDHVAAMERGLAMAGDAAKKASSRRRFLGGTLAAAGAAVAMATGGGGAKKEMAPTPTKGNE
jgi:hypothetical protein